MKTFSAGKFEVFISDPHPMWTEIRFDQQRLHGIHHTELSDLIYALQRARDYAAHVLPDEKAII